MIRSIRQLKAYNIAKYAKSLYIYPVDKVAKKFTQDSAGPNIGWCFVVVEDSMQSTFPANNYFVTEDDVVVIARKDNADTDWFFAQNIKVYDSSKAAKKAARDYNLIC